MGKGNGVKEESASSLFFCPKKSRPAKNGVSNHVNSLNLQTHGEVLAFWVKTHKKKFKKFKKSCEKLLTFVFLSCILMSPLEKSSLLLCGEIALFVQESEL